MAKPHHVGFTVQEGSSAFVNLQGQIWLRLAVVAGLTAELMEIGHYAKGLDAPGSR